MCALNSSDVCLQFDKKAFVCFEFEIEHLCAIEEGRHTSDKVRRTEGTHLILVELKAHI